MQAYNPKFAKIYNQYWANFALHAAPLIREYYERTAASRQNKYLLDIFCGTGDLALQFLEAGYQVDGLDLSEGMLDLARQKTAAYLASGRVEFILSDAADFNLPRNYGLVTATYDAVNHLPDCEAMVSCFRSVYAAMAPGGVFIFDMNTRLGLEAWNGVRVEDTRDLMLVTRGIFDRQAGRATSYISGFALKESGGYERFDEMAYNTAFEMETVRQVLQETRFRQVHFARLQSLGTPVEDPEAERRVWIVAYR
jgi:SAM-dependent methyltransferase